MTIAVTGAAGNIGSRVACRLAAAGHDVVAIVRRPGAAPVGPHLREQLASYDEPEVLTAAMRGTDTLVFVGSDGPTDVMLMHHHHILGAAMENGVRRIVLLSSQDADAASPFCYARVYALTESWTTASCAEPIIIRAGLYGEFLGSWIREAGRSGILRLPMASAKVAPIARRDVADALIAGCALRAPSGNYTVTGPRALDLRALAEASAGWAGRPVDSESCSAEQFAADLAREEPDPWWRYAFSTMFAAIEENRFGSVTDDLRTLTGNGGMTLEQTLAAGPVSS